MIKKIFVLIVAMVSVLSVSAQTKRSEVLVETVDSVVRLGNTRHFVAYCKSGRLPVVDVLYYQKIRGHEKDFRVVSLVVNDTIQQRTLCAPTKITKATVVVQRVTMKENNTRIAVVEFTNGEKWETEDLSWLDALPGQKVSRDTYDGETYRFARHISDGEVDQEVYYSVMAQK